MGRNFEKRKIVSAVRNQNPRRKTHKVRGERQIRLRFEDCERKRRFESAGRCNGIFGVFGVGRRA